AIRLRPDIGLAHNGLGLALAAKSQLDEAIECHREFVRIKPGSELAHRNLGLALREHGQFREALASLRQCRRRLIPDAPQLSEANREIHETEQLVELDAKLDGRLLAVLTGKARTADDKERAALAWVCQRPSRRLYAASARLWHQAFTAQPSLAQDLETRN